MAELDKAYATDKGKHTYDEIQLDLITKHWTAYNEHQKVVNKAKNIRELEKARQRELEKLRQWARKTMRKYYDDWSSARKTNHNTKIRALEVEINRLYDARHILGLSVGATLADIKTAYHKQALMYHPDRWSYERTGMTKKQGAEYFKQINGANQLLLANESM